MLTIGSVVRTRAGSMRSCRLVVTGAWFSDDCLDSPQAAVEAGGIQPDTWLRCVNENAVGLKGAALQAASWTLIARSVEEVIGD